MCSTRNKERKKGQQSTMKNPKLAVAILWFTQDSSHISRHSDTLHLLQKNLGPFAAVVLLRRNGCWSSTNLFLGRRHRGQTTKIPFLSTPYPRGFHLIDDKDKNQDNTISTVTTRLHGTIVADLLNPWTKSRFSPTTTSWWGSFSRVILAKSRTTQKPPLPSSAPSSNSTSIVWWVRINMDCETVLFWDSV